MTAEPMGYDPDEEERWYAATVHAVGDDDSPPDDREPTRTSSEIGAPVDWSEAWKRHRDTALADDWFIEPIFPRGAHTLIYAPKKREKSLFTQAGVTAVATGRPFLGRPAGEPRPVLVIDFENEIDKDVLPRFEDFGYGGELFPHLHWYSFPRIAPLDTAAGARQLDQLIVQHAPDFVVIDSFARAVAGAENDADTVRNYYRHAGLVLKRHGVTSVRLDNTGKDETAGPRGSSSKGDDVDLIWKLRPREGGLQFKRDAQRGTLAPDTVNLQRHTDPLRYTLVHDSWPAGTKTTMELLDRLTVPTGASVRTARAALKAAGETASNDTLTAALRARRAEPERHGTPNGTPHTPTTEHDQ